MYMYTYSIATYVYNVPYLYFKIVYIVFNILICIFILPYVLGPWNSLKFKIIFFTKSNFCL